MGYLPSMHIMQMVYISPSSRSGSTSVHIFPGKRSQFWKSLLRDARMVIGTSLWRSFGRGIHRGRRTVLHPLWRDASRRAIERLEMGLKNLEKTIARPWNLSYMPFQSLGHQQDYATCVESRITISSIVRRQHSLSIWEFASWIQVDKWLCAMAQHSLKRKEKVESRGCSENE